MQDAFNKYGSNRTLPLLVVLSVISALLSACGGGSSGPAALKQVVVPSIDPAGRRQIVAGWLEDYSAHVEDRVTRDYQPLLDLPASRMTAVCPEWSSLDRGQRTKFWSAMLWSIAGPESSRNRAAIYRESSMSIDVVTGKQIRSEGLLQLSYVDLLNYRYPEGDISWEADRKMALKDYATGAKIGNPDRTILNAYANLNLGLFIMNRLLTAVYANQSFEDALGHYWHTMQDTSSTFRAKVLPNMRSRMPECF
jgi:hypothetical protein